MTVVDLDTRRTAPAASAAPVGATPAGWPLAGCDETAVQP